MALVKASLGFNPSILFRFIAKLHTKGISFQVQAVGSRFHNPRPSLGTFNNSDMPRLDTCYKESHLHF